jgi:hypothetical protein
VGSDTFAGFECSPDDVERGPADLVTLGTSNDLVGGTMKKVEQQGSGGADINVGKSSVSDSARQK